MANQKSATIPIPMNQSLRLRIIFYIWLRYFLIFKGTWFKTLIFLLIEPMLYFLTCYYGFNAIVEPIDGVAYIQFVFPALLANTAMLVAFFETAKDNGSPQQSALGQILQLTPVTAAELFCGELCWAITRALIATTGLLGLGIMFNLITLVQVCYLLPLLMVASWLFASLGLNTAACSNKINAVFWATYLFIMPMYFFCETFFPLKVLPELWQYILSLLPHYWVVRVLRNTTQTTSGFEMSWHLILLTISAFSLTFWLIKRHQNPSSNGLK